MVIIRLRLELPASRIAPSLDSRSLVSPIPDTTLMASPLDIASLHAGHHRWLVGWLRGRVRCEDDAADLAQDVFVRLLREPRPATLRAPRAYLATVGSRLALNLHRRRALEQAWLDALAAMPSGTAPSPEEQLVLREVIVTIDNALAALGDRVRSAFLLAQFEGWGYAAIARELGVTPRTVVSYVARAMAACCLHAPS